MDAGAAPPALAWPRSGLHGAVRLHHRDDFVQGEWPEGLREQASALADGGKVGTAWFASLVFAAEGPEEMRRAQFLLEVNTARESDTQKRFDAGTVTRVALLRAQLDRARAEQDLLRARFLLAEVPAAAGRQHIIRREPPPPPR